MKRSLILLSLFVFLTACTTKKPVVRPEPAQRPIVEIFRDSLVTEPQTFPELGVYLKGSNFSVIEIENLLRLADNEFVVLNDTLGIGNLFSQHSISGSDITYVTEESLHPGKLADLLEYYNTKLVLVIDPATDDFTDVENLFATLKSWKIPVSHWQIGSQPYLKSGKFTWASGNDFVSLASLYTELILKNFPNASIFLAGGSDQYNVFTDQMLDQMSRENLKHGILLNNFSGRKKSNYHTINIRQEHVLRASDIPSEKAVSSIIKSTLDNAEVENIKYISWEITGELSQSIAKIRAFGIVKQLFKNAKTIRSFIGNGVNGEDEPTVFTIQSKSDSTAVTVISNTTKDTIGVNLNQLALSNRRYFSLTNQADTVSYAIPSNGIVRLKPDQMIFLGEISKIIKSVKMPVDLFTSQIIIDGPGKINIAWPPVKDAVSFELNYGLNKIKPDRKLTTKELTFKLDSLRIGRTYFFEFSALDSSGTVLINDAFKYDVIPPVKPSPPLLSQQNDKLILSWEAVDFASYYTIRQFNHGEIKETTVPGDVNEIVFDGLMEQREYLFAIKAENALGESDYSSTRITTIQARKSPPPYHLIKEGNILSWQDSIKMENRQYNLYYGSHPSKLKLIRSAIADTFYVPDMDSIRISPAYYAIKSFDRYGESKEYSNIVLDQMAKSDKMIYVFDAYQKEDSTIFVIKFDGLAPEQSMLILQNRKSRDWSELRIDLQPYKIIGSSEYRLKMANKDLPPQSTTALVSALYNNERVYSKAYELTNPN